MAFFASFTPSEEPSSEAKETNGQNGHAHGDTEKTVSDGDNGVTTGVSASADTSTNESSTENTDKSDEITNEIDSDKTKEMEVEEVDGGVSNSVEVQV